MITCHFYLYYSPKIVEALVDVVNRMVNGHRLNDSHMLSIIKTFKFGLGKDASQQNQKIDQCT